MFIDTAIFIYLIENNPHFGEQSRSFLNYCYKNDIELVTSVITYLEYCIIPYRNNDVNLIKSFLEMINISGIQMSAIQQQDCDTAARLRAEYNGLKSFDALQIAVAFNNGCDFFITNDKQLIQVSTIKIEIIENW